jgi:hypothetical protein
MAIQTTYTHARASLAFVLGMREWILCKHAIIIEIGEPKETIVRPRTGAVPMKSGSRGRIRFFGEAGLCS